jgi:hypothetical protein
MAMASRKFIVLDISLTKTKKKKKNQGNSYYFKNKDKSYRKRIKRMIEDEN